MNSQTSWSSPEHWHMVVKQALTLLALIGLISAQNVDNLDAQLYACITAAFMFGINGWALVTFIKQQVALKQPRSPSNQVLPALLAFALLASPARAADPCPCGPGCVCPACPCVPELAAVSPWRQRMEDKLQQLQQQQRQAPAPAPLIIQQPPVQVLPIVGDPRQQLPIVGDPRQQLPIGGAPLQPLPPNGTPQQALPIGGPNQQPLVPSPPPMPPATGAPTPQSYTRHYALHKGN